MIVVLAPFPSRDNEKDGMIQRVAHVDALISPMRRVYLQISSRRFLQKEIIVQDEVTVYSLNLFLHVFLISRLLKSAGLIYIHSVHNALFLMFFKTRAHVVFDAHGVVPEEVKQQGRPWVALWYSFVERYILARCNTLVCVTNSMLAHLRLKHGERAERKELVLPILPFVGEVSDSDRVLRSRRDQLSVIYAGGTQVWQNLELMLAAAERQKLMHYTFLTGDLAHFEAQLKERSDFAYECLTVSPQNVKDYYLKHEYGFILRDDNLINRVACPTKLVEYLYWGVIPVLLTPRIGDFDVDSLHAVTLSQFVCGKFPSDSEREAMRRYNHKVILDMFASAECARYEVVQLFHFFGRGYNRSSDYKLF